MINITIPDPDAYNPLAHLADLADGDYPTGRRVDGVILDGRKLLTPYDEIVVIKDHKPIGFRLPDGTVHLFSKPTKRIVNITRDDSVIGTFEFGNEEE